MFHARMVVSTLVFFGAALATPVAAAVIDVQPGPGTPLQDAIAAASPGDVLRVSPGEYDGPVVVDKKLKIRARPNTATNIRAGCAADDALVIAADDVEVRNFQIFGGSVNGVVVEGRSKIKLTNLRVIDDCDATGEGVRIASSTKVRVSGTSVARFDLLIHVVDLATGADVKLIRSGGEGSNIAATGAGALIENVEPKALTLIRCSVERIPETALELRNADGVRVTGGLWSLATQAIVVDSSSDDNSFIANRFHANGTDVADSGTSNCWRGSKNVDGLPVTGNPSTAGCP